MHTRVRLVVLLLLALLSLSMTANVIAQESDELLIYNIWARATAPADMPMAEATPEAMASGTMGGMNMARSDVSAVYMTLENPGAAPVRLKAAAAAVAGLVEIHETKLEGDVMRMRPVEGGIEIPAGGIVELKPGGLHIMLMELKTALVPGTALSLTLTFDLLDATGASTGETRDLIIGAPILTEPPVSTPFVLMLPWARPTTMATSGGMHGGAMATQESAGGDMPMRTGVSAIYARLINRGEQPDRLVVASTAAAGLVEIHESKLEGDVMQMRPIEGGLEIPAGGAVELKPGGLHIMLMELQRELVPGDAIAVTLIFESGAELVVGVPVYDGGMSAMPMN